MGNENQNINGKKRCCGIAIQLDEKLLQGTAMSDELKSVLKIISDTLNKYDHIGIQPLERMCVCLFDDAKENIAFDFLKDLKEQNVDGIVSVNPVKNACYIDPRYLGGIYKGALVTLPPIYLEHAIIELLEEYCFDWKYTQDTMCDIIAYVGELGGGRELHFICGHGDRMLAGGLSGTTMRRTCQVSNSYKNLLRDIEKDVIEWCDSHSNICKINGTA